MTQIIYNIKQIAILIKNVFLSNTDGKVLSSSGSAFKNYYDNLLFTDIHMSM